MTGLPELGRARAHAEERAKEVDAKHPLEAVDRFVFELDDVMDGRVVDEDIDVPEGIDRELERVPPRVLVAHVEMHETCVVTELLRERLALIVEDVGDHNLRAFAHEQPCLRLALSARRAGDDGDLAFESAH